MRTTASSKILDTFVRRTTRQSSTSSKSAGAVIVGKTNCDEFAMGSSNENSAFGPVRNPWATDRTPGGSSGGSAAAVAAQCVPLALGSDTGGSIRQPASFCGVVGLKPTYGRVSRYGLLAFASSLDQIGPFARTVGDAALALSVIAGRDPMDSTSSPTSRARLHRGADGNVTRRAHRRAARVRRRGRRRCGAAGVRRRRSTSLRGAGATLVDIDLPHAQLRDSGLLPHLHRGGELEPGALRRREVRLSLAGDDQDDTLRRCTAGRATRASAPEVKRRIMLGTYVLSAGYYDAYYLKAQQVRTLMRRDYDAAFERSTSSSMPTSPIPPFKLGEKTDDPLQMYLADIFTVSVNLAGLPGHQRAVRIHRGRGRLPIGLQLIGRMFDEATMLRVADAYRARDAVGQERRAGVMQNAQCSMLK